MRNKIREIKKAICKMIDMDLPTYEFDGKVVTKEDLFEILDKEYIRSCFHPMALYSTPESNICDADEIDPRTTQVTIEMDSADYPNTKPWIFNLNHN